MVKQKKQILLKILPPHQIQIHLEQPGKLDMIPIFFTYALEQELVYGKKSLCKIYPNLEILIIYYVNN